MLSRVRLPALLAALVATACARAEEVSVELEPRDETNPLPHGEFIEAPDLGGGGSIQCSYHTQNCPPGEKCMPWANDGGGAWNALKCAPLADDPGRVGDPCTFQGSGVSGIDDCDRGLMCWDVDFETNEGRCIPMIRGSDFNPICDDPLRLPTISGEGVLGLCMPLCSPLLQDCPTGQGCYPLEESFTCLAVATGFPAGSPCEFLNVCEPGTACIDGDALPDCDGPGCCSYFCDTTAPDCPEGQQCTPWETAHPDHPFTANVGVCTGP